MTAFSTDCIRRLAYSVGKLLLIGGLVLAAVTWPVAVAVVVILLVLAFVILIWAFPRCIKLTDGTF